MSLRDLANAGSMIGPRILRVGEQRELAVLVSDMADLWEQYLQGKDDDYLGRHAHIYLRRKRALDARAGTP